MDPQNHHQQQQNENENNSNNNGGGHKGGGGGGGSSSFLCSRQSSTRWTPTTDQIRILKELYYNNGIRSPNADQIQRISARLRQYGKIEGKNVFYWFQNHKARERQKKRFTTSATPTTPTPTLTSTSTTTSSHLLHHQDHQLHLHNHMQPRTSNLALPNPPPTWKPHGFPPHGVISVGQMGSYGGYGSSVSMENSFRDCNINGTVGGSINPNNYAWIDMDNFHGSSICNNANPSFNKTKSTIIHGNIEEIDDQEDHEEVEAPEIETLPLFPTHSEDTSVNGSFFNQQNCYYKNWNYSSSDDGSNHGTSRTSLELSLGQHHYQDFI